MRSNRTNFEWNGRRTRTGALLGALAMLVTLACASPQPPPPASVPGTYVVGPPDTLLVTIYPDPILQQTVTVRIDGKVSVDLIGDVEAEGRTTSRSPPRCRARSRATSATPS